MKFWFSGEIDARVGETYRAIRLEMETRLNADLGQRNYGPAVVELAIIPMLLGPEFSEGRPERRLVKRKEKVADYRLSIDFAAWQVGSELDRKRLLLENVLESIRDIGRKLPGGFEAALLQQDIERVFPEIVNHSLHGGVAKATHR